MALEFRIFYRGELPSAAKRKTEFKQELRARLHAQIKAAWDGERLFNKLTPALPEEVGGDRNKLGIMVEVGGHRFVPIASARMACFVGLDFLLLRPESEGVLLDHSGDVDNRIKTLIDALRVPTPDEIVRPSAVALPTPCYCLMDDDRILTRFSVEADRLLGATDSTDAVVVVRVTVGSRSRSAFSPYSWL